MNHRDNIYTHSERERETVGYNIDTHIERDVEKNICCDLTGKVSWTAYKFGRNRGFGYFKTQTYKIEYLLQSLTGQLELHFIDFPFLNYPVNL